MIKDNHQDYILTHFTMLYGNPPDADYGKRYTIIYPPINEGNETEASDIITGRSRIH